MKFLFLNLKRFDLPAAKGGVNSIAPLASWGTYIVENTQQELKKYNFSEVEFVMYLPEAHLLGAAAARCEDSPIKLGSQSVYREDVSIGGNFGAFTSNRPATVVKEMGCGGTIIGHSEERKDFAGVLAEAGVTDPSAVNRLLNRAVKAAQAAGLKVLYCIGETSDEQENWQEVLGTQLSEGLVGVDMSGICIAYEPIWSIGPGKTPADKDYITKIARFIKERLGTVPVVYGGGLKAENAKMLASIPEIDGGLIALTRFQGDIGFYPAEYLEIIKLYLGEEGAAK